MARTYSATILIPMTAEMAAEIRRRANADERPVAAYLRRIIARVLASDRTA